MPTNQRWAAFLRCAGHLCMSLAAVVPDARVAAWLNGVGGMLLAVARGLDGS